MDDDEGEVFTEHYYRVTLAYDVLVEGEPDEDPAEIAARASDQEQVRTGIHYRAVAVDDVPVKARRELSNQGA